MKRISILLLISIMLLPQVKAQFFKHLDKSVPGKVVAACHNSNQLMTVCYLSGSNSLTFATWNPGTGKWTTLNTATGFDGEEYRMAYLNDSLFVHGLINGFPGMYKVSNYGITKVGVFKRSGAGMGKITGMQVLNNHHIMVAGYFDSIDGPGSNDIFSSRVALFNGSTWQSAGFSSKFMYQENTLFPSQRDFASLSDTAVILFQDIIYRYVYPNKWTKTLGSQAQNITLVGNKFIYTIPSRDTIYHYVDTNNIKKILTDKKIFGSAGFGSHQGKLFMFDRFGSFSVLQSGNAWKNIYFFGDSGRQQFYTSNNSHLYVYSASHILYKNKDYGAIAEINLDSGKVYGYDTIAGRVFWDKDNNNQYGQGDVPIPNAIVYDITYPISSYLGFTDVSGFFSDIIPDYNDVEYTLGSISFDTCLKQKFTGNVKSSNTKSNKIDSVFFPLKRTSLQKKNLVLRSYSSHGPRARLLDTMEFFYSVYSRDCDYSTSSAMLKVTLDSNYTFISSTPAYSSRVGNHLTFNLSSVDYSGAQVKIRGLYSNAKYSINNWVRHTARITTMFAEDTADNVDSIAQKMVYSYDPNAKHSYPEGRITKELKNIRYHIEFQNEGTDDAYRVTVIDTLNLKMPVYEFQMVGSSHPYSVSISGGNIVKWVFDNVMLKPKSKNEPASKGFLTFDARVKGELRQGDSIRNKAYIYFDYNEPVITNFAVIRMEDDSVGVNEIVANGNLHVYPNPAQTSFIIENKSSHKNTIFIYNTLGLMVSELTLDAGLKTEVSISNWAPGVYMIVNEFGAKRIFVKL